VDGTPRLVRSLGGLQSVLGQPEAIQAIAFSPDGRFIAASDASKTLQRAGVFLLTPDPINRRLSSLAIWRAGSGEFVAGLDLGTGIDSYNPLAFSPDGRVLAVGAPDGSAMIIDAATWQLRRTLQPVGGQPTGSLSFSPDGTLATGTLSGILQLWNPISGAQLAHPLPVAGGPISSIAFDPRGLRFATAGSQDGLVKLFATATLQQEGTTLNTEPGAEPTATFGPHGDTLLVVNNRGSAFTWPLSLAAWEQRACTIAGRNLTRQEWNRLVPGQAYTTVCP
jgi:WD40 repeat protein